MPACRGRSSSATSSADCAAATRSAVDGSAAGLAAACLPHIDGLLLVVVVTGCCTAGDGRGLLR